MKNHKQLRTSWQTNTENQFGPHVKWWRKSDGGGFHQGNENFIIPQRCDEKMRRLKNQRKPNKTMKSHKHLRKTFKKHRKSIRATCKWWSKSDRGGFPQGNEIFITPQRYDEKMRRLKNQRKPNKTMKNHKQLRKHENKHRKPIRATCQMVTKFGRRRFSSRKREFHQKTIIRQPLEERSPLQIHIRPNLGPCLQECYVSLKVLHYLLIFGCCCSDLLKYASTSLLFGFQLSRSGFQLWLWCL